MGTLRRCAVNLARADTYTPASYWFELPIREMLEWMETVLAMEKERPKPKPSGK